MPAYVWSEFRQLNVHRDVQFMGQLKYKTHVAVNEKFTFMTSMLKELRSFN